MKFTATHFIILVGLLAGSSLGAFALGSEPLAYLFGSGGVIALVGAVVGVVRAGAPPSAPAVLALLLVGAVLISGCAKYKPLPDGGYSYEQCQHVRGAERGWRSVAIFSAALAGGGGLATIPIEGETASLIVAGATAILGGLAAAGGWLSGSYASEYDERCSVDRVEPPPRPVTP